MFMVLKVFNINNKVDNKLLRIFDSKKQAKKGNSNHYPIP